MASPSGPTRDVEVVAWLASRRIWTVTAAATVVLLPAAAGVTAATADRAFRDALRAVAGDPVALLALLLLGRALGFAVAQRARDRRVAHGRLVAPSGPSPIALLTVAAFSAIGLVPAGVVLLTVVETAPGITLLAAGVAGVVVPVAVPLLLHQLGRLLAADRYRRAVGAVPAVWHYLWTLPVLLAAWLLVAPGGSLAVPVPPWLGVHAYAGDAANVAPRETLYLAVCTPTGVAFAYGGWWYVKAAAARVR